MNNRLTLDGMIDYLKPYDGKFLKFEKLNVAWALGASECTIDFSQVNIGNEALNRVVVDYITNYLKNCNYIVKYISYPGKYITAQASRGLRSNYEGRPMKLW